MGVKRGNMNRFIAGNNQKLRQIWAQILQLKDRLKKAIAAVDYSSREEKPSIMSQLVKYKE